MHTPDESSSSISAAADPPAVQNAPGLASTSVGPSPPPHRTSESGHPLERKLEAIIERQERLAEHHKADYLRAVKLGWKKKNSPHRPVYLQRREKWWKALARRANAVWDLEQFRNPVKENRSSPDSRRLRFEPEVEDNDGGFHYLRLPSCKSRPKRFYQRRLPTYRAGNWADVEGHGFENTSWFTDTASWEQELEEAKRKKKKKSMKQPVKPSASLADSAASPSRNPSSCPSGSAPASSPKRRREEDDNNNPDGSEGLSQRPASPKRVRLSPPPPKSSSSPARSTSRPWTVSSQKRRRDDEDDNNNDDDRSQSPKRIRLSKMPLPKRVGFAPPALATGPVLVASPVVAGPVLAASPSSLNKSSSASQVPAAALDSPSRQPLPPPSSPSPFSSPSPHPSHSPAPSPSPIDAAPIPAVRTKRVPVKTAASYRTPRKGRFQGRYT